MSYSKDALFKEIVKLKPLQAMQASVDASIKYASIVGAATFISGMLGGSKTVILGSLIGSSIAEYMASDTLQFIPRILRYETTQDQKEKLAQSVRNYNTRNNIFTLDDFIHSVTTDQAFMGAIIQIVIAFLSEIGYKCSMP